MGFTFTLESANTIANLTFGKVLSCYRDIFSSTESYYEFILFLDQFGSNIYSNEKEKYYRVIHDIKRTFKQYEGYKLIVQDYDLKEEILLVLQELSTILGQCVIKSLLLPRMKYDRKYDDAYMMSSDTLRSLAHKHPGNSCLILQPQERPGVATIFNAFPKFEVALRQADLWPAVFFWDNHDDCVFVPIKNENELHFLYDIIRYEKRPFDEIRRFAENKTEQSHYLFQLSDLHFGARNVDLAERRLRSLVKNQISKMEISDDINFVVTGDAVDSPEDSYERSYKNFSDYFKDHWGQKPIRILGNHDINNHGLAVLHTNQRLANIVGDYPKIKVLDESKVILLLFNSNTNGNFAEGEIGNAQMAEMGILLDEINNLNDYLLIAVMHHHLIPIPEPDYYNRKWLQKILPRNFYNETLRLIDADLFIEWLKQRNVKLILHGHKHIPFFAEHEGINIVSCGSSTGQITHKEKDKTFISYNIIKISKKAVTCTQFAEEIYGAGAKNIQTVTVDLS